VRRSALQPPVPDRAPVILVDTIGELGALRCLADVAFVGGSLDGQRDGQNMIEPAAYGAAVSFGPHVWNFKEPAARLLENGAAVQILPKRSVQINLTVYYGYPRGSRQAGTVEILSSPRFTVADKQPVEFISGQSVPVPDGAGGVNYVFVGITMKITPRLVGDG